MHQTLIHSLRVLTSAALVIASTFSAAQTYPNKPIKVLVGVPPGGSTDGAARMYAEWLQESLGQPAYVENRTGANTAVAAEAVARSPADGYTLLLATDALLAMPLLQKVNFDPFKDFAPIGAFGVQYFVIVVHPSLPVNSVQEFIAYAKARPGKLNYGSSGNAGSSHIGVEKFKLVTGLDIVHIPYKGAGPALTDALAGQYQMSLWTPTAVSGHVNSGKLRALALTSPKRVAALPQVPTFAEAGLPAYKHNVWQAYFAPVGTPKAIIDKLNGEIAKMSNSPKNKAKLDAGGVEPLPLSPEQFAEVMRADGVELAKSIKAANIKID